MKKIILTVLFCIAPLAAQNVNFDSAYRSERVYFYRMCDNTLEAMRVSLVPDFADTSLVLFDTTFTISSEPVRLFDMECTKFNIYNLSSAWSAGVLRRTDKVWLCSKSSSTVLIEAWRREF